MGTQYRCKNALRRVKLKGLTTNGIDFLEVLDADAEAIGRPRQTTLLIYAINTLDPATLPTREQTVVTGGVRVKNVSVEWILPATDDPEGIPSALLGQGLLQWVDMSRVLVVRVSTPGDFSTYELAFVASAATEEPPAGWDRILSEVAFSFKADCPSDFDCEADQTCEEPPAEPPPIDYLSKDFSSFRRLMLDRLSTVLPAFTERNPVDLGVALVEVLAYAADHLSYYQDAVATEAYLGTARRRESVRRHARLLDYRLHEGCNSRTFACFEVTAGGAADHLVLLAQGDVAQSRPRLLTRCDAPTQVAEADLEALLDAQQPQVFELMHDTYLAAAHNAVDLYTWGDEECCLPRGATRATLVDQAAARLLLRAGDVLVLEARRSPQTGAEADADPARRHAVRLTRVHPEARATADGARSRAEVLTDDVYGVDIVEIAWDEGDALPFSLPLSAVVDGVVYLDLAVARANAALCDRGLTVEETLDAVEEDGRFRPRLSQADITHAAPYEHDDALGRSAGAALVQDAREALPQVSVTAAGETWLPQSDLLGSDRFATDLVVEMDEEGRGTLRFGDGVLGKRPVTGTVFDATYRIGNGQGSNVGAEAIAHVALDLSGIEAVRNPVAAVGGTDPEPLEDARQLAPEAFKVQQRAVTAEDYAEVCGRHPEVQGAVATMRWTGSWTTVFITVDRQGGREVDADFEADLRGFLERFRMTGYDLEVDGPQYVPLDIGLDVCVEADYFRSDVKEALLEALSNADLTDGQKGFFHPDNFSFGEPVYLSRLIATVMGVPGVHWVDVSTEDEAGERRQFHRFGKADAGEWEAGVIEIGRLEIARLDNDPNRPENGRLQLNMEGGR